MKILFSESLSVALLAVLFSVPFSLSAVLFAGEYYRRTWIGRWIKNILELSKNIPSILWGITVYGLLPASGIFSVALALAAMIVPYASASLFSCMSQLPRNLRESAYCLGATPTGAIWKIILPAAKNGIIASYLLALGKALGETIIVVLLAGNTLSTAMLNQFLTDGKVLFSLALGLFIITASVNSLAEYLFRKTAL